MAAALTHAEGTARHRHRMPPVQGPNWPLISAVSLALFGSQIACAADWDTKAGAGLSLSFTDNVGLTPDASKTDDLITEANATLDINRTGGKIQTATKFAAQWQSFANGSSDDRQLYQLDSNITGEFFNRDLAIEARLTHSQQIVDNTQAESNSNLSATNNRTDVRTLVLTPSYRNRFGSYGNVEAAMTLTSVETGVANTGGDTYATRLRAQSGRVLKKMSLSLSVDQRVDDQADSETLAVRLGAGLRLRRGHSLTLDYRISEETVAGVTSENDGGQYNVGWLWQPRNGRRFSFSIGNGGVYETTAEWAINRRQQLSFNLGNQKVARDYGLSWSLRSKRGTTSVDYSEARQSVQTLSPTRLIFDEDGTTLIGIQLPSLTDASFIQTRLATSSSLRHGRSAYSLSLVREKREFVGNEDLIHSLTGRWTWQESARRSHTVSMSYIDQDLGAAASQDQILNVSYALSFRIRDNLSATVNASHNVRSSSNANTEFTANTLSAGVSASF